MKKLIFIFITMLAFNVHAKEETWIIDKAHTKVGFEISHLIISSVEGRFTDFSGKLIFDADKSKESKKFWISVSPSFGGSSMGVLISSSDPFVASPPGSPSPLLSFSCRFCCPRLCHDNPLNVVKPTQTETKNSFFEFLVSV